MIQYRFCSQCKSALTLSNLYPKCPKCNIVYYKNSKPTAGILPIKDNKVLLSKRSIEPFKNCYDIIGGFLENGEHPQIGAKREAKEETGLDIEPFEILGIYIDQYGEDGDHTLNIHYLGKVVGGILKTQTDEVSELIWIPILNLPTNEGFENTKQALKDLKERYILNTLPTIK